jgi:hypothetical protein
VPIAAGRRPLKSEDYRQFTLGKVHGHVYLNYCEVGKPLWDVFKDDDDVIGDGNIRPLRWYSGSFRIWFGEDRRHEDQLARFNEWFDRNRRRMNALGFVQDSPDLSLGEIPVAALAGERDDLVRRIGAHASVVAVTCS